MFMASCYWPPVPLDTPLSSPWNDNITTFGDALRARIPDVPADLIPAAVPIIDRCWCDFSGGLFEPFNTTRWEVNSVEKVAREIEMRMLELGRATQTSPMDAEAEVEVDTEGAGLASPVAQAEVPPSTMERTVEPPDAGWPFSRTVLTDVHATSVSDSSYANGSTSMEEPRSTQQAMQTPAPSRKVFSAFRREYDLRPYGFDMVLDLGWSR